MFYKAISDRVKIGDTWMDYVAFGLGDEPLVLLPGLSDGLKTVHKQEKLLAMYYKLFAKRFRVYVFSRKDRLEAGYTTRHMARDQSIAMEQLGITRASVMGISQGGMIAQYLAIDYPEMVERLVIGVSVSRPTETVKKVVGSWIDMAKADDYKSLAIDTMEKTFTERHTRKYRPFYPIISRMGKPKDFTRFLIQADACLGHNAYDELTKIQCPTLVIGGDSDDVVGRNTSEEMANRIKGSQRITYKGLGHGAYEEAKDFNQRVMSFIS